MVGERGAQAAGRAGVLVAFELAVEVGAVEDLLDLGLLDRPFERAATDDARKVEQRAGHGGARDAVDGGDVVGRQRP